MGTSICEITGCRLQLKKEAREGVAQMLSECGQRVLRPRGTIKVYYHECYFCGRQLRTPDEFDFEPDTPAIEQWRNF